MTYTVVIPDMVSYVSGLITPEDSLRLRQAIVATSPWSQERLKVKGITESVPFPRLVAWHGDAGIGYRYSGIDHPPADWTEPLLEIRALVESLLGIRHNGVLLNRYRDGKDSIGRHSDREDDLVYGAPIVGISLGATRQILFKHKGIGKQPYIPVDLEDGSALIMYGDCQQEWTHEIKKKPDVTDERISLTFRKVKS